MKRLKNIELRLFELENPLKYKPYDEYDFAEERVHYNSKEEEVFLINEGVLTILNYKIKDAFAKRHYIREYEILQRYENGYNCKSWHYESYIDEIIKNAEQLKTKKL